MYNKNLILDKKILTPDPTKPELNIYIANDYGFCGNFNSSVSNQIRKEYVYGDRQFGTVGLAKKYGVYQGTIWFIVNNVHWKKVIKCPESN